MIRVMMVFGLACGVWLMGGFLPAAATQPGMVDDFNDGVWNVQKHWDAENFMMGGLVPDKITFDEAANPGFLTIHYLDDGDEQATLVARDDVKLAPEEWVKVDLAIPAVEPRVQVRVGLGLAASRGRNLKMGAAARENSFCWGLRSNGSVSGHFYGAGGREIGSAGKDLADYRPRRF